MIRYLKNNEIDVKKWDACVEQSPNGLLYASSFFLNNLCMWDALVLNDYEAVMPLPKRKKWGVEYIYNPAYAAQCGVTGNNINTEIIQEFLNSLPSQFKFLQLNLTEYNTVQESNSIKIALRTNYVLPLNKAYTELAESFTKDARKNIRQAVKNNLTAVRDIEAETVFTFYKNMYGQHLHGGLKKDFEQFIHVCKEAIRLNKGFTIGIKNDSGALVSASFWGIDNKRLYYLLGAPTTYGKKLGATYFLMHHIIETYAGSNLLLDFEGSDIENVAAFYKQFGPEKKIYPFVTINRLPVYLKWLK